MRIKFFTALLCSFVLTGQVRSQEVVVARDARPSSPKQVRPAPETSGSESGESTEVKPQVHEKRSAFAPLTIEQMRMAGAVAAEGPRSQTRVEPTRATKSSNSQAARTPDPTTFEVAKPARKETHVEPTTASSRTPTSPNPKSGVIGPIRPTMIESGRESPDNSGQEKANAHSGQPSVPQSANRPLHKQEAVLAAE